MALQRGLCLFTAYGIFTLAWLAQSISSEDIEVSSCVERCEEAYFPGKPCYCNDACVQYENCCYDFIAQCKPHFATNDSWVEYNGHVYQYTQQLQITALQASMECKAMGALLLSINGEEEFNFIHDEVLRGRTLSAFIGGSDAEQEGKWMWSDGTVMALPTDPWHQWYTGEPDNENGDEDCSVMTNYQYWVLRKQMLEQYIWKDYNCDFNAGNEIQGYICEGSVLCQNSPCENGGTCYYIGGESQIECVCPENYLGEFCQYEVREGEIWSQCGVTHITANEGIITSPLYPKHYPSNVRCEWYITGVEGRTLSFSFTDVDIEASKHCKLDYLTVYDGHEANRSSILFGPFCGEEETTNEWSVSEMYTTSSNTALVQFRTDEDVNHKGFQLEYRQEKCGQGQGNSGCGTKRTFQAECGEIIVEEHEESACDWQINVGNSQMINLTFAEFKLQDGGIHCLDASLEVYEGLNAEGHLIGQYCGWRAPFFLPTSASEVYIRLTNSSLLNQGRLVIQYSTYDISSYEYMGDPLLVTGDQQSFSLSSSPVHISQPSVDLFQWHLRVPQGLHLQVQWQLEGQGNVTLEIYQGLTEELSLFTQTYTDTYTDNQTVEVPYFQATIKLYCDKQADRPTFQGLLIEKEWHTESSNCFRPAYFDSVHNSSTENHMVSPLQPVMLAVADNFFSAENAFYSPNKYCKWKIRDPGYENLLKVLDANVYPVTEACDYDGFVIYNGPNTSSPKMGPFCGANSLEGRSFQTTQKEILVIFYSDPGFGDRKMGKLRILAHKNPGQCILDQMGEPSSVSKTSTCGTILSPNFPGLVKPGLWFWIYQAPDDYYFNINVHYVRGPAGNDPDCKQSFKVIEISKDSNNLRQYEVDLLKLCGETDLFIPPGPVQVPPNQKFGLELKTITNTLMTRWEFKLSYTVDTMEPPRQYPLHGTCPENYIEWRGHCYRYYQWVLRHYQPEEYKWQQTWHHSLEKCEAENATLVSVYDKEEAYFLQYVMAHAWFWDPSGPYIVNHRLLYMGLHNMNGEYMWTSGTQLSFADWYRPRPDWDLDPIYLDSVLPEIINFNSIQPSVDVGSLCSGMVPISPFKSLQWLKIPCDYPMYKVGTICKMPAPASQTIVSGSKEIMQESDLPYSDCPETWFLMGNLCYKMLTNYVLHQNGDVTVATLSIEDAMEKCEETEGRLETTQHVPELLYTYLRVWNHTSLLGGVLVGTDPNKGNCLTLQPSSEDLLEYQEMTISCEQIEEVNVANVLCIRAPTEECGAHEFQCDNKICVSVDSVCDNHNDCSDFSDERDCHCEGTMFKCENNHCIPLSLRCDFFDQCGDGSDETGCKGQDPYTNCSEYGHCHPNVLVVTETCSAEQFQCKNGECVKKSDMCDFKFDCVDHSDETDEECGSMCHGFQCYSGMCVDANLRKDGIGDCPGLLQEDEKQEKRLLTLFEVILNVDEFNVSNPFGCIESPSQVNCRLDVPHCYERSRMCIYDTQVMDETRNYAVQSTCRDGTHLRQYCESIECPGMYHCPGSYCIPYRKVCDGKSDCRLGEDEMNCEDYVCPGLFKCKSSGICLPHSEVCDGVNHCGLYHEDEKYCNNEDVLCDHCNCLGRIADCSNGTLTQLPTHNQVSTRTLRGIFLANNHITLDIDTFSKLHWLSTLDLSNNQLRDLPEMVFHDLVNLQELDLSVNLLIEIRIEMFQGLMQLKKLDLSNNRLALLTETSLDRLVNLEHLIIENNPVLLDVDTNSFTELENLRILNSDAYKFCCIAKQVEMCTPEADAFSNCEDLMANYPLQISIWILGITAAAGNLFVLIWRLVTDRQKASSLFIINLGCSDLLMGVYLIIIAAVDVYYRGRYILHADTWRSSSLCQLAGVLAMLSSEMSVFMLSTITLDRCLTILFPLKFNKMRIKHARMIVVTGWVVCFIMSVVPVIKGDYFGDAFFGRTGVCLPLIVSNEKLPGWEYSVFIFLVLNLLSFVVIFIGYAAIFMSVKTSIQSMGTKASATADEYSLAKKLMIIVATDFMCWVPIILIGFAALGGAVISPQVSAWIAVFILPLNSAVNPLLYTISAIDCRKKKKQNKKSMYTYSTKTSGVSVTEGYESTKISMQTVKEAEKQP